MRWTAHMEDSLQKISADPECLNDEILVLMVRVFRIQEDIAQITWRSAEPYGNATSLKAPPLVYVGSLRASLEAVKKQIPPELADNSTFLPVLSAYNPPTGAFLPVATCRDGLQTSLCASTPLT